MRLSSLILPAVALSAAFSSPVAFAVAAPTALSASATSGSSDAANGAGLIGRQWVRGSLSLYNPSYTPGLSGLEFAANTPLGFLSPDSPLLSSLDETGYISWICGSNISYKQHYYGFVADTTYHYQVAPDVKALGTVGFGVGTSTYDYSYRGSSSYTSGAFRMGVGAEWVLSPDLIAMPTFGFSHNLGTGGGTTWEGRVTGNFLYSPNLGIQGSFYLQSHAVGFAFGVVYYLNNPGR